MRGEPLFILRLPDAEGGERDRERLIKYHDSSR
jgi:hypothetical protein